MKEKKYDFLTLALQNTPFSAAVQDRDLKYIWAFNQKSIDPEKIIGRTDSDFFQPGLADYFINLKKRILEEGISAHEENWIDLPGGRFYLSIILEPVRDEKGNITGVSSAIMDLTARKRAEEALRESEERYRKLHENISMAFIPLQESEQRWRHLANAMPQLVWTAGPDGIVDFYNERRNEFDGFSQDADGNWIWSPVVHPDDMEATMKAWTHSLNTGEIYQIEHRVKRSDGIFHWYLSRGIPVRDKDGKITKWYGTATDIHATRESEERYRTLFDNMTEGFSLHEIITDDNNTPVDYRFLEVNHAFELLTGLSRDRIIGKRVLEVLPDNEIYWIENFGRVALTGEPVHFDNYSAPLGRWYEVFAYRHSPRRFAVMFTDITARKETEKALRLSEENYRLSKQKLDLALENANIGLWEWNVITDSAYWDERSERMLGIRTGEHLGNYETFMQLIHEEDADHIRKAITNSLQYGAPFETIFRTRPVDGISKYISSKAIINRDEHGKVVSLSGVNFDITGLKEDTERVISQLNEDLLRSNRELENFAFITSHDLQEPLRMVTSYTQLLERKYAGKLDDDAREYIKYSVDGAKRMYDLINGLLAYSRISRKQPTFTTVDTNKVLEIAKTNLSLVIRERKCKITASELPDVFADQNMMILLFQNLIANAIKFSRDLPEISVSCKVEQNKYMFAVEDKGIGIDRQYHEKIFEIFKRLMPRDEYEGTGIGLAICKRIIGNHGGSIWVESEPGKGSVFYFTLPIPDLDPTPLR